jgi:hypothetical protein
MGKRNICVALTFPVVAPHALNYLSDTLDRSFCGFMSREIELSKENKGGRKRVISWREAG